MARLSPQQAREAVALALRRAGASEPMALATAKALVLAQMQGLVSHGLSRVSQYMAHLRNGRVAGNAVPAFHRVEKKAACLVDAQDGLAFPACELAVEEAIERAKQYGISIAAVTNSHHCGVLIDHLRPVAEGCMVGLAFANSPAAMPAAGGKHPVFGTNPIAALFPRRGADPLMIDLSLSEVARGKVMLAAGQGQAIPHGWALDREGRPTTDAAAALEGSMLPIGASSSSKGAMLALTVELLASALIGAHFGFEATSFFVEEGNRPRIGQTFIVVDPEALAGTSHYFERVEVLIAEMLRDEGVRLPGARREQLRRDAELNGLDVADDLLAQWAA